MVAVQNDVAFEVVETLLRAGVLSFGQFKLKSGRISPYFFNLGRIFEGQALSFIAKAYASLLHDHFPTVDVLFGPAYKGIPLASTTATAFFELFGQSLGVVFDRKEPKDHGEGGVFVGSALKGNIVLVDDVITAGSAVRSSLSKMAPIVSERQVQGLLVAMDRQEAVVEGGPSAIQSLQDELSIEVKALLTFEDLLAYLQIKQQNSPDLAEHVESMLLYRKRYGACT